MTTRSGSNAFHGEIFGHVRDHSWNARDWFANSRGLAYSRPSYESFGGLASGPVWRNRTFFLVSVENSRLKDSGLQLTSVPSVAARQSASLSLQRILTAFPLPTGLDLGGGAAEGLIGLGRASWLGSYSARIDQALGSWGTLFGRYIQSPSTSNSSRTDGLHGVLEWRSITLGVTAGRPGRGIHEIRFNDSRARFRATSADNPWWPAFALASLLPNSESSGIWPSISSLLPGRAASPANVWGMSVPGLGQFVSGAYGRSRQNQLEFRETMSIQSRRHQFRIGLDYVRLEPSRDAALTSVFGEASSLQSLLQRDAITVTFSQLPRYGSKVQTASLFAQDTFRVSERVNMIYGVRWELTPPTEGHLQIPTVSGLWTGTNWTPAHSGDINGTAPWPKRYRQFAPRIGLAYRLPMADFVLRAGAGIFYDTTLGASINPINGAPFNSWLSSAGATGLDASAGQLPREGLTPDVAQFLSGPHSALRLPMSYQWKVSLEKGIGSRSMGSMAYLGSANRHLLGNQVYIDPSTGILDRRITLTENSSNYQALQLRYSGSLSRSIYASTSYAWSHCMDDGSADSSAFLIHPGYQLREARASCNFDVRHSLTAGLSYRLPRWLSGWTGSGTFRTRSGFPIDIVNSERALGQHFDNAGRPNLVPATAIWIQDPHVAGQRRLNPAAFATPSAGETGTLGRNAIYGKGLAQLDVSLRREFELMRGTSVEVGLNIFNALNHPAFADPVPFRSNPFFGQAVSMRNLMLGSGTANTGLPALFQTGGSRSAEFSFRFSF